MLRAIIDAVSSIIQKLRRENNVPSAASNSSEDVYEVLSLTHEGTKMYDPQRPDQELYHNDNSLPHQRPVPMSSLTPAHPLPSHDQ